VRSANIIAARGTVPPPNTAAELRTDARRTAVADAIRTVCPTTSCGEQPQTNTRAVAGTKGHGQDGMTGTCSMTGPRC
jgi:hypothetical protein